jgi:Ca2+-binding EF-hand superfamily protein
MSVLVVAAVLLITILAGVTRSGRAAKERSTLERRFDVMDVDGNGVWQRHDYQQLTRRLGEAFGHAADSATGQALATGQRALFDALLSYMDADGDGQITQDEFVAAVGHAVKDRAGFDAAARTAARTLVLVADQDGNGALDAEEYARLAAVYGARADAAARAFDLIDRNHDGVLDTAELALAISQFFTSRDPGASGNAAFGHLRPASLYPWV